MSPRRLVSLYPAPWRHRYGEEFLVLLEDHPPRGLQLVDIVWGAIDARLFPQAPEGRFRMFTRIAGLAAIAVGALVLVNLTGWLPEAGYVVTVPIVYAGILVGLVGIHLRQVSARPMLAWFGFAAGLFGVGLGIVSMVLGWAGVLPTSGGEFGYLAQVALWIGLIAMGAVMLSIGTFPVAVGLAFTIGAPLALIGLLSGGVDTSTALGVAALAGVVLLAAGWIGVGLSLLGVQPQEGVLGTAT